MKTMTVAIPDDVFEKAERRTARLGISLPGEVGNLLKQFGESDSSEETVPVLGFRNRADTLCQELAAIAGECRLPNWDGQGAVPVSPDTLRHAQRFVNSLPSGIFGASVGVEPDGHMTLEWYRDPHWTLSVSVSPESNLYYAALFGASDVRGREVFQDDVPDLIFNLIRRASAA